VSLGPKGCNGRCTLAWTFLHAARTGATRRRRSENGDDDGRRAPHFVTENLTIYRVPIEERDSLLTWSLQRKPCMRVELVSSRCEKTYLLSATTLLVDETPCLQPLCLQGNVVRLPRVTHMQHPFCPVTPYLNFSPPCGSRIDEMDGLVVGDHATQPCR
jgi:hypothetical protein